MANVVITIRDKIASIPDGTELICNNPSDVIEFDFDEEWNAHELKTARFAWQRKHVNVPFSGNLVNVPDIDKTNSVEVGVYADDITSTAVKIPFRYSIKSVGSDPKPPQESEYDQIVSLINDNAVRGPEGYTPVRGDDYWTAEDIEAIKGYVEDAILEGEW